MASGHGHVGDYCRRHDHLWQVGLSRAIPTVSDLFPCPLSFSLRYIFGDNEPYYVDANRLLKAMGLPQMSGNYSAQKYLQPYNEATGQGYATHAVTTGISSKLCVAQALIVSTLMLVVSHLSPPTRPVVLSLRMLHSLSPSCARVSGTRGTPLLSSRRRRCWRGAVCP